VLVDTGFSFSATRGKNRYGSNARELNEIERLVEEYRELFLEAWHEHLG
jgi:hypothetical protein